jgi:hypothetical protein
MRRNPTALTYRLSTNGGKSWSGNAILKPPIRGTLEAGDSRRPSFR